MEPVEEITVGYWNIRGLAAPLRMMVMYAGVPLKAVNYPLREKAEGGYDASAWFGVKPALKAENPLMNLPYVISGGHTVTQSNACFTFLGRRLRLLGDSEADLIACEQLLCEIMDIRNNMVKVAYSPTIDQPAATSLLDSAKSGSFHKLELWLEREKKSGKSGNFLVADKATAPDFHLWEMLDQYTLFATTFGLPDPLETFPHLKNFHSSFRSLPQNSRYFASVLAGFPNNNKMAAFGSTPSGARWVTGADTDAFDASSGTY